MTIHNYLSLFFILHWMVIVNFFKAINNAVVWLQDALYLICSIFNNCMCCRSSVFLAGRCTICFVYIGQITGGTYYIWYTCTSESIPCYVLIYESFCNGWNAYSHDILYSSLVTVLIWGHLLSTEVYITQLSSNSQVTWSCYFLCSGGGGGLNITRCKIQILYAEATPYRYWSPDFRITSDSHLSKVSRVVLVALHLRLQNY